VRYESWESPVEGEGDLEPAETSDVYVRVKASSTSSTYATTIKWVIDDGSPVRKGDVLVYLDDAALQDQLQAQRTLVDQAKFDWEQAEANHVLTISQNQSDIDAAQSVLNLARLDLRKYVQGEYPQQLDDVSGRLEQWKDRAAFSLRMLKKGFMS